LGFPDSQLGGADGIQLGTQKNTGGKLIRLNAIILTCTYYRADRRRQNVGDGNAVTPPSLLQSACISSSIPPSSAQAALAFVQIRSYNPRFSPRGMGCTSGFARDHVPPTLSRNNTAKNGAFHRPFDDVYGDTTIIATTCPWHPLPRPIRFLRSSADRGTSPTCRTTAGAHRPAAGSPGGAVRTPSLSVDNHQKITSSLPSFGLLKEVTSTSPGHAIA
jgi:hypothetical protein